MTDGAAAFQPGADEVTVPFRPRSEYTGYRAFGSGDGAVLMAPSVAHDLRCAAELATADRRIAGGLLYGRGWADELGTYLVIDHYLEADPWDSGAGPVSDDSDGDLSLSAAHLRLLREDAASMDSGSTEAGWWRTCAELGEFGPRDFVTQGELVGPDGVGLLVYGSGSYWGTAYLGPDGHAPDSAGTLAVVPDPADRPRYRTAARACPGAGVGGGHRARAGSGGHRGGREPGAGAAPDRRRAATEAGQAAQGGFRLRDAAQVRDAAQAGRQARGRRMPRSPRRSCPPTLSSWSAR